jgi:hypothetical protein
MNTTGLPLKSGMDATASSAFCRPLLEKKLSYAVRPTYAVKATKPATEARKIRLLAGVSATNGGSTGVPAGGGVDALGLGTVHSSRLPRATPTTLHDGRDMAWGARATTALRTILRASGRTSIIVVRARVLGK